MLVDDKNISPKNTNTKPKAFQSSGFLGSKLLIAAQNKLLRHTQQQPKRTSKICLLQLN